MNKDKEYDQLLKTARKEKRIIARKPINQDQILKLTLPLPTSVNKMYRIGRRGSFELTQEARNYKEASQLLAKQQIRKQKYSIEPQGVWLVMEVTYYFPDREKRDCHNQHKLLADTLEGLAYENDRWVIIRDKTVVCDELRPRLEIEINCQKRTDYIEIINQKEKVKKKKTI